MTRQPIVLADGEGEKRWFYGGGIHTWKASAKQSGGAFILFEDTLTRGKTTPLHRHPNEDEVVYIIDGEILLQQAGRETRVGRGGVIVTPRGVEHAFLVTSEVARMLFLQTPGSGDAFYRGASEPLPDTGNGPVDFGRLGESAKKTGATEILGPPPFSR
jgi:quercetin dioxygenase-like cupin family protein